MFFTLSNPSKKAIKIDKNIIAINESANEWHIIDNSKLLIQISLLALRRVPDRPLMPQGWPPNMYANGTD
ncbi:hypothetical protein AMATHDRAFT_64396 [Amanita thiersii Skay4041]|uniref:Uncharacterized protein n=1 Tax=Amanita thiersii Skay4041 TaxID=703135 RepID=A0A2A9NMC9_9AGAR|nr:hypothetical protein AMATHDRAFT_64396 [Amanita thiersii Skay4041]